MNLPLYFYMMILAQALTNIPHEISCFHPNRLPNLHDHDDNNDDNDDRDHDRRGDH